MKAIENPMNSHVGSIPVVANYEEFTQDIRLMTMNGIELLAICNAISHSRALGLRCIHMKNPVHSIGITRLIQTDRICFPFVVDVMLLTMNGFRLDQLANYVTIPGHGTLTWTVIGGFRTFGLWS